MGQRYVISGSPGSGKTTLVETLRPLPDVWVSEESARTISSGKLGEQGKVLWDNMVNSKDDELKKWDRLVFERAVLQNDMDVFTNAPIQDKNCFFDCGVVEAYSYLRLHELEVPDLFTETLIKYRYDQVFFTPMWPELLKNYSKPGVIDWGEKLSDIILKTYESLEYEVTIIPKVSLQERVNFIMEKIKS